MYPRTVNRKKRPVSTATAFALAVLFLNLLGCATQNHNSHSRGKSPVISPQIVELIEVLGRDENRRYTQLVEDIKKLAQTPETATELLIRELKPIDLIQLDCADNNPATDAEGRHVVWCLRAIYFLTGERFCATTQYEPTDSELDQRRVGLIHDYRTPQKVRFFVEWMSRGSVYFAPLDAQMKIISQWKSWLERHGKTHNYRKDAELNDWYFG